jgi:predicted transcriptional regulator of viral defense system
MKYLQLIKERYKDKLGFTKRDLNILLKEEGISDDYLQKLIYNLLKKKEIIRITKGKYTFAKDIVVSGFSYSPFYYGLQEALSFRNLWEQETNPVIITTKKVRSGLKSSFDGGNIDFIDYYNIQIPVSDIEKTIIDFVYYKEESSLLPEVIKEIKEKINKKKLNGYLKEYPRYLQEKVLSILK